MKNTAEYTIGCSTTSCRMTTFTFGWCLCSQLPDSLCLRSPELNVALHSAGCCLKTPHWSEGPGSAEFDDPASQRKNQRSNDNQRPDRASRRAASLLPHTSFSHSVSAFCRRRISISTWLRACFSLTSKAPLSVSVLVRISLQDPSSCSVLAHLRRQSSKFFTIWMKSRKQQGQDISATAGGQMGIAALADQDHELLTGLDVVIEKVNLWPHLLIQALEVQHGRLHDVLWMKTLENTWWWTW